MLRVRDIIMISDMCLVQFPYFTINIIQSLQIWGNQNNTIVALFYIYNSVIAHFSDQTVYLLDTSITSWHYFPVARTSWSNILPCIFCCPKTSSISVWQLLSKTTFWLILFKNTKWCDNDHSTQGCPSKVKTTSAT